MPQEIKDYDRDTWQAAVNEFIRAALTTYEMPNVSPCSEQLFNAPDFQFEKWECCILGAALYQTFKDKRPEAFIVSIQAQSDYYAEIWDRYPIMRHTVTKAVYDKYIPSLPWDKQRPHGHSGDIHLHELVIGLFDFEKLSVEEIHIILLNVLNDMKGVS